MSWVCLLFCLLLEFVEEIWIFLAAGELMACCKAAALRLWVRGLAGSRAEPAWAMQPLPSRDPRALLSSNKNLSSGVFHLSVKGNEISLESEMQRNGIQLSFGRSKIAVQGSEQFVGVRAYVSTRESGHVCI